MTECVILFRNPGNRSVGYISSSDGDKIMIFPSRDSAGVFRSTTLRAPGWPYQIVELEDL